MACFLSQHSLSSQFDDIGDQCLAASAINSCASFFSDFFHRVGAIFHGIDHGLQGDVLASADRGQDPRQIVFAALAFVADARQFHDLVCRTRPGAHCFSDLRITDLIGGANNFVFSHDSYILFFYPIVIQNAWLPFSSR